MRWGPALLAVLLAVVLAGPAPKAAPKAASGAVLKVGPGEALTVPSQAARVAGEGDTIEIAAGEYFDCAVWPQNRITITGPSDPATPAVLTDRACQGKAIFVLMGRGVTVRHLTFTRVRVPDGNGAGIRAEGADLTVAHSRFVNNQSGILSVNQPEGTLAILDSVFERNGAMMGEHCVATLHAGAQALLRIERSRFFDARACDMVRADAGRVEVVDSRFEDGDAGAARHMLALGGGTLLVRGSVFARGAQAAADVAIERRDLWGAAGDALVQGTTLENGSGRRAVLVHNLTGGTVRLDGNVVASGDRELDEGGWWMARARATARMGIDSARAVAGKVKRVVRGLLPF